MRKRKRMSYHVVTNDRENGGMRKGRECHIMWSGMTETMEG